ncbi:hypothetical protein K4K55_001910 [Colletotrichum sp. SAR 10_96]|nr:hypothetical protein K4K55_001910 [Colletotrichum sp. SAR 10_96]
MSSSDGTTKKPLTDRELEILKHAWNCMKTPPEIDYPKLAEACGMTNPRSAANAWGVIKKKLFADMPAPAANEDGTATTPAKRKRATPRKKTASAPTPSTEEDDEEADELTNATEEKLVVETPVKKKRTPAKKKAAPVAASQGDADAEDTVSPETPAKKKRATPAKKRTPAKVKKEQEEAAAAAAEEDELTTIPQEEPKFEVKEEAKANEDVQMEGGQDSAEI